MALGSIFVRFGADITDLQKGVSQSEKLLRGFETRVSSIATGLATLAAPVVALGAAAVRSSSRLDLIRIGFEGILGSAEKAGEAMGFLRRLSARTPFSVAELGESLRTLVALNLTLEEATDLLPVMADTLSAIGRTGPDAFFRLAKAITDVQAKGKLAGPEVRQFAEMGIPIRDILAKALGRSAAEIERMQEAGIPAAIVLRALTQALQARFGGAAERSLGALANQFRNVRNEVDLLLADFGEELQPTIRDLLVILRDDVFPVLSELIEAFGDLSPNTKRWAVEIVLVTSALVPLLFVSAKLAGIIRSLAPLAGLAAKGFAAVGGQVTLAAGSLVAAAAGAVALAKEIRDVKKEAASLREQFGDRPEFVDPFLSRIAQPGREGLRRAEVDAMREDFGRPPGAPPRGAPEMPLFPSQLVGPPLTAEIQAQIDLWKEIESLAGSVVEEVRTLPVSFDLIGPKLEGMEEGIRGARTLAAEFTETWKGGLPALEAAEAEMQFIKSRLTEIAQVAPEAFSDERVRQWIDRLREAGLGVEELEAKIQQQNAIAQFEAQRTQFAYELLSASVVTGFGAIAAAAAQVASGAATLGDAVIGAIQSILQSLIGLIAQMIAVTVIAIVQHGAQSGGFLGALVAVGLAAVAVSAALAAARAQSSRSRSEAKSFAAGGIISEPMLAVVGDAPARKGPEVVSPLEDLRDMLGLGGMLELNVFVGEEKIAQRVIRLIPRELRRLGVRI